MNPNGPVIAQRHLSAYYAEQKRLNPNFVVPNPNDIPKPPPPQVQNVSFRNMNPSQGSTVIAQRHQPQPPSKIEQPKPQPPSSSQPLLKQLRAQQKQTQNAPSVTLGHSVKKSSGSVHIPNEPPQQALKTANAIENLRNSFGNNTVQ